MSKDRYKYFRIEARELFDALAKGALEVEKAGPAGAVARMLRHAHTLKGAARVVALPALSAHAHELEECLEPYREAQEPLPADVVARLWRLIDAGEAELATLSPGAGTAPTPAPVPASTSAPVPASAPAPVPAPTSALAPASTPAPGPAPTSASGPALTSAPDLASTPVPAPAPTPAPGPASTAPGPSSTPVPGQAPTPVPAPASTSALAPASTAPDLASTSAPAPASTPVPASPPSAPPALPTPVRAVAEEAIDTVRVPLAELDDLLGGISETAVRVKGMLATVTHLERFGRLARELATALSHERFGALARTAEELAAGLGRGIGDWRSELEHAAGELEAVRGAAHELRLIPAQRIFDPLERTARDAAAALGRPAVFTTRGGEIRLDGHVLAGVRDALMHAVRNAVDHGLGPAGGTVTVEVVRAGGRVAFHCKDDGRGIDAEQLKAAAVRRGLLAAEAAAALSRAEALALVFIPGFSTREDVSAISGRGVGLDVVADMARRLKGEARIESQPGRGTCLTLEVPLSLSAIAVLEFEAGPHTYALPLDGVRGVLQLEANPGATLAHAGREIPLLPLASLLPAGGATPRVAVLVGSGEDCLALGVDHLLGANEVVIKPLPASLGSASLVAGACFDASGVPRPLLDPRGLVEAARAGARPVAGALPARQMPILVIDDSLTTRMLEQSILESAGYEVDLAVHAEDGLVKARERAYGLFIVDVEMPGMSGYEFVALTRQDPVLGRIPAMLVTSLASPADRQRGVDAGASAYVVKGEFEQGGFLATVQRLLLAEGQGHG